MEIILPVTIVFGIYIFVLNTVYKACQEAMLK